MPTRVVASDPEVARVIEIPGPVHADQPKPFCIGCQVFIGYDDILAALLSTGEMRMFHYLCPNGIREVVFREMFST